MSVGNFDGTFFFEATYLFVKAENKGERSKSELSKPPRQQHESLSFRGENNTSL